MPSLFAVAALGLAAPSPVVPASTVLITVETLIGLSALRGGGREKEGRRKRKSVLTADEK